MSFTRRTQRRGVLLLVVMALLALMATVTMTFVLVTGLQMRAARGVALSDVNTDSPEQQLDAAMDQVLRGSTNLASPIASHSLLEDVYGVDARRVGTINDDVYGPLTGTVGTAITPTKDDAFYYVQPDSGRKGDVIEMTFTLDAPSPPDTLVGFYDGRLITMLDGRNRGVTRRILRYIPAGGAGVPPKLHVLSFGGGALPVDGDRFLINDRAFDGTGFGLGYKLPTPPAKPTEFDQTINHQLLNTTWERALLPNHSSIATKITDLIAPRYPDIAGVGGADEDYDAPDYQNEFMAVMVADPTFGTKVIKPSFHDPALINYWMGPGTTTKPNPRKPAVGSAQERDLKRKIFFRPLLEDHPGFIDANPAVSTVPTWYKTGPWDVDNDGNGDPDSVWIDLGSPVQTDASGRQYKALYAILCVDLDGRINLNAQGSPMHLVRNSTVWPRSKFVGPFADKNGEAFLPIGQGYGPADIVLNRLFQTPSSQPYQPLDLFRIMHGGPNGVAGRYGEPFLNVIFNFNPASPTADPRIPMPGRTTLWSKKGDGVWGNSGQDDDLDGDDILILKFTERGTLGSDDGPDPAYDNRFHDDNFPPRPVKRVDVVNPSGITQLADFRGNAMADGPLTDIDGDGAFISDLRGAPIPASIGEGDDAIDDPYELDLTRTGSQRRLAAVDGSGNLSQADAPFTPSDLEALMRINDADIGTLASRLLALAPDTFLNNGTAQQREFLRSIMTTESWDAPIAGSMVGMPEEAKSPFDLRGAQLLVSRLAAGHLPPHDSELRSGLYPRFFDGLKLDLNRPFGNSADDDISGDPGFGVIDEPGDGNGTQYETLWNDPAINNGNGVRFDYDNDGKVDATNKAAAVKQANLARQAMARHLYVLAMALRNKNAPTTNPMPSDKNITARELAQWAINVVDFRDSDSIMTAFEYDKNPFNANGWSVDGDLTTDEGGDRAIAWGCERPELLITETLAGHDRGTDDTSSGKGGKTSSGMPMGMDLNYDQVAAPNGWAMVELYNPQSALSLPKVRNELNDNVGLDLTRKDPVSNTPVWRLAIGQPTDKPKPDDPIRSEPKLDDAKIERTVYFTQPAGAGNSGDVKYFASGAVGPVTVAPGGYVVIGSTNVSTIGAASTDLVIGRGAPNAAMRPTIDFRNNVNKLLVKNDGSSPPKTYPRYDSDGLMPTTIPATTEKIRPPLAIEIDKQIVGGNTSAGQFNISEPTSGYKTTSGPLVFNIADITNTEYDEPWDAKTVNQQEWYNLHNILPSEEEETRQFKNYNRVYLQRLANPLIPWSSETNPYLTVDSMPIDLHVYSSTSTKTGAGNTPGDIESRERKGDAQPANGHFNIWRQYAGDETSSNVPAGITGLLKHTLGFLNTAWHVPGGPNNHRWLTADSLDSTVLANNVLAAKGLDQDYFIGAPRTTPPWLTWNNRPFVSKFELMMVPKSSPAELLAEFSVRNSTFDPYGITAGNTTQESEFNGQYDGKTVTHLLNFFHTSDKDGAGATQANDLYRIFEFVDVPSRFSGTEEMLSPTTFEASTGSVTNPVFGWRDLGGGTFQRSFAPPFNYLSRYREPGRINLNTIFDDGSTWGAILGGFDGYASAPNWQTIVDSRRGYAFGSKLVDTTTGNPILDVSKPTMFARPFRSFSGGTFVPTDDLKHPGIDSTLLRSKPANPSQPLFALSSTSANTDTDKNPFYRYQLIDRLPNLVTTRSNVYAVWITVGYFEVEPAVKSDYPSYSQAEFAEFDRVFPDGVRLKGELGADTGKIERHRAFYIVDRLVPVAFERGKTHNTRKTIRLRTMIE